MTIVRNALAATVAAGLLAMPLAVSTAFAREGGMKGACKADVEKLCPDAKPGGGEIRKCLHDHEADLSDACKQAMARRHARRHEKSSEKSSDAAPAAAPEAAPEGAE